MYRTGAREKRHAVIRFVVPRWQLFFAPLGGLLVVLAFVMLSMAERDTSLSCRRDDTGNGQCVYVHRFVMHEDRTTFDVRSLRGAHVAHERMPKGKATIDRVYMNIDGTDTPLGDSSPNLALPAMAGRIDRFAHDTTVARLDERFDGNAVLAFITAGMMIVLGCGVAVLFVYGGAARRLVLSEQAQVATLERRVLFTWKKVWSVPLHDVLTARVETRGKASRLVIDTKNDGALVAVAQAHPRDPAVDAIQSFLTVDESE
jgi:hypothetical protein